MKSLYSSVIILLLTTCSACTKSSSNAPSIPIKKDTSNHDTNGNGNGNGTQPPTTGGIIGKVSPAGKLYKVYALLQPGNTVVDSAGTNAMDGSYTLTNLKPARYHIQVQTSVDATNWVVSAGANTDAGVFQLN